MRGLSTPVSLIILVILTFSWLTGCAIFSEYDVSIPAEIPAGLNGTIADGVTELRLQNLTVTVEAQNYRGTGRNLWLTGGLPWAVPLRQKKGLGASRLIIWIGLKPIDDKESFGFDPRRTFVKEADSQRVEPTAFIGPSSMWTSGSAVAKGCGKRRYSFGTAISKIAPDKEDIRQPTASVPFKGPCCLVLVFDTSPAPEESFGLSIDGLEVSGRQVRLPEIKFTKGLVLKTLVIP